MAPLNPRIAAKSPAKRKPIRLRVAPVWTMVLRLNRILLVTKRPSTPTVASDLIPSLAYKGLYVNFLCLGVLKNETNMLHKVKACAWNVILN